ncbi:hypothetical protein BpHYR1_034044 [Brachionus plicatilis]|uniref:Uncharacterized protein n=1 Tax=Brachionus plicatilis TaxID=10195 RepID=A0A3M7PYY3_BRAPC|nr:hypothetical protein BpHYR1_034044 [Brachionus plicatilis]
MAKPNTLRQLAVQHFKNEKSVKNIIEILGGEVQRGSVYYWIEHFIYTQNEKAKLSGVSPKCGSSTKKRYEETGSVSDRSRSGRPWKLTLRDENYIFREIRKDPTSSYQKLVTDFNSKTQEVRISNIYY